MITTGSNVILIRSNGRKYMKARSSHVVGSQPGMANMWIDRFEPMTVIYDQIHDFQPSEGEYRMFGFKMGDKIWYKVVWIYNGKYFINFPFEVPITLELV